ncbi:MAG: hypothetical protein MUC88_10140 [Planctomycetes bacterium]|jgi:Tfp pilus assembly protein PilO|nr:hypothetical protein [Planctomycetota bacterium]
MASASGSGPTNVRGIDAAGVGVFLLVSLVGYMTLVSPLLQQRSAGTERRRETAARQQKLQDLETARTTVEDRLAAARQHLATSAVQLESAARINKRVAAVTEFFSRCRLHVDDVQTGRVSGGTQYDLVPLTIIGRGAYHQCGELLHGLCAQYPDMSVMRLELSGNPREQADAGKFRLDLFWYAAPSGPAARGA